MEKACRENEEEERKKIYREEGNKLIMLGYGAFGVCVVAAVLDITGLFVIMFFLGIGLVLKGLAVRP